jgi:DNA-binding Xre family transcriptional regulator
MVKTILQQNLELYMLMQGLTPKSLSVSASLSKTIVLRILDGTVKKPSLKTLTSLSKTLNCTIGDLTKDINEKRFLIDNNCIWTNPIKYSTKAFAESISLIDEFIVDKGLNLSYPSKANLYIKLYALLYNNSEILGSQKLTNNRLEKLFFQIKK